MERAERENWRKVKEALEEAGKTESMFYRRALAILRGERDPLNGSSKNDLRDEGADCLLVHFLADATAGCSAVLIKADDLVFAREELTDAQGTVGG